MRRRLGKLGILAVLGLTAWLAAPALSLQPYLPVARDFEQPLPRLALVDATKRARDHRPGTGPVTFRSPPIEAPHTFDLVGVARELNSIEFRTGSGGGPWSKWVETDSGDPVYAGGADRVQVRSRGYRPTGALHYVNVSGTTSSAEALLTRAREAINSGFISAMHLVGPAASAAPPKPPIITREEWGADRQDGGCLPKAPPSYGTVKAAVIHHTAGTNDYAKKQAPGIVLGICRYHEQANGWNDIGYNALVDRFGRVYEGRDGGLANAVIGAQAQGVNSQTTGVASIGTHTDEPISDAEFRGFVHFLAWKLAIHHVDAKGSTDLISSGGEPFSRYPAGTRIHVHHIFGHRRVDYTDCPGHALHHQIRELRRVIQHRIDRLG
jgi:hypothetical protein